MTTGERTHNDLHHRGRRLGAAAATVTGGVSAGYVASLAVPVH